MTQHMRIALIAPPWLPVPPPQYGGTETVVDRLAIGLQSLGHEVLLFTTGDSTCPVPRAWVREKSAFELLGQSLIEAQHVVQAYQRVADFDIVHDHTLLGPLVGGQAMPNRVVMTNHGPFVPEVSDIVRALAGKVALVAISHDQASHCPVPVDAVIHHGVRPEEFAVGSGEGDYVLFLGRFSPDKGAKEAILIAREAGVPLILAAKMREKHEIEYFHDVIEPSLGEGAEYVGEVGPEEKVRLLGSARALLNPIHWPEPFGLVMIEALACGTPVLTRRWGAAPEIVDHGVTGFVCDSDAELVEAVSKIDTLDRAACHQAMLERFSADVMVANHVALYERMLARSPGQKASPDGRTSQPTGPPRPRATKETIVIPRTDTPITTS